jgi:hypothetical protein
VFRRSVRATKDYLKLIGKGMVKLVIEIHIGTRFLNPGPFKIALTSTRRGVKL